MSVPLRVCWIVAVALNAVEMAMVVYSQVQDYLHPVGDVFVPDSVIVLFLAVPTISLVVLVWAAAQFRSGLGL